MQFCHLGLLRSPNSGALRSLSMSSTESTTSKISYKHTDIITVNAGGTRFDTYLKTLLADRSSDLFQHFVVLLETDLTEDKLPPRDIDGAFFLDRDPKFFRTTLNNLRFLSSQKVVDEDSKSNKSNGFLGRFRKGN